MDYARSMAIPDSINNRLEDLGGLSLAVTLFLDNSIEQLGFRVLAYLSSSHKLKDNKVGGLALITIDHFDNIRVVDVRGHMHLSVDVLEIFLV